jgi:bifunctional DNase/RNase
MTGRDPGEVLPVTVWRLGRDQKGEDVVLLRDETGRVLPIWIAPCEAAAIWLRLEHDQARALVRRPMTHDLLLSVMERLGISVERVVVDDLSNGTYYATLYLQRNGERFGVDSRPSDAIALGLRAESPVFVSEEVMTQAGEVIAEEEDHAEPDEGGSEPGEAEDC